MKLRAVSHHSIGKKEEATITGGKRTVRMIVTSLLYGWHLNQRIHLHLLRVHGAVRIRRNQNWDRYGLYHPSPALRKEKETVGISVVHRRRGSRERAKRKGNRNLGAFAYRWFSVFRSDGSQGTRYRWDVIYCFILTWIILFGIEFFKSRPHYSNERLCITASQNNTHTHKKQATENPLVFNFQNRNKAHRIKRSFLRVFLYSLSFSASTTIIFQSNYPNRIWHACQFFPLSLSIVFVLCARLCFISCRFVPFVIWVFCSYNFMPFTNVNEWISRKVPFWFALAPLSFAAFSYHAHRFGIGKQKEKRGNGSAVL